MNSTQAAAKMEVPKFITIIMEDIMDDSSVLSMSGEWGLEDSMTDTPRKRAFDKVHFGSCNPSFLNSRWNAPNITGGRPRLPHRQRTRKEEEPLQKMRRFTQGNSSPTTTRSHPVGLAARFTMPRSCSPTRTHPIRLAPRLQPQPAQF